MYQSLRYQQELVDLLHGFNWFEILKELLNFHFITFCKIFISCCLSWLWWFDCTRPNDFRLCERPGICSQRGRLGKGSCRRAVALAQLPRRDGRGRTIQGEVRPHDVFARRTRCVGGRESAWRRTASQARRIVGQITSLSSYSITARAVHQCSGRTCGHSPFIVSSSICPLAGVHMDARA